jgi:hypothetical protein
MVRAQTNTAVTADPKREGHFLLLLSSLASTTTRQNGM